jgi:hypothetical protein
LADTTGSNDSAFSLAGELLGSNNDWSLGERARSEDLEVTLEYYYLIKRHTDLTTSIITALAAVEALRASSGTRVQSLSRLMVGLKY